MNPTGTAEAEAVASAPQTAEVVAGASVDAASEAVQGNETADSDSSQTNSAPELSDGQERPQEKPPVAATEKNREPPSQTHSGPPEHKQQLGGRAHPRMERTIETLHRASTVARGVIEDEVKRVEKIRHVSSVMIEEASYDPSLRFVLVALGLFILFLILLVVSKVMG